MHAYPIPIRDEARKVFLVANARSGKGAGAGVSESLRVACRSLGLEFEATNLDCAGEAVKAAARGGLVVAAGGDGTVRSVAEKAAEAGARLAVIPTGTFNFFARTHGIPLEPEAALEVALQGECRAVRLGAVNGRAFLINASLGVYAQSIEEREKNTDRFGRSRLVATLSTVTTFLREHNHLEAQMHLGDQLLTQKTPTIFIGNNALQLRNLNLSVADCMKQDRLAVVLVKPLRLRDKARLLLRGAFRKIENEERLETFCIDSLSIYSRPRHQQVALDGELFPMHSPFVVRALPGALQLMVPRRGHA